MTKSRRLIVAGREIPPGTIQDLNLDHSESYTGVTVGLPIRVIRALRDGPVVFLTALVHGDELNGLGIIHELMFEQPLALARGTVIALPVVNVLGLDSYSRYLPDRRDLNRSFPGSPRGSLTGRLAHMIWNQVIRHCDYGLDFHTAAVRRTNYPNIRADLDNPQVWGLANAFGCELMVHNKGAKGSLRRVATSRGVPTIVIEAGEVWKVEPGVVQLGVRGALNILKYLRMIPGRRIRPVYSTSVRKSMWIRAEQGGVLKFHVSSGDMISKGALMASNLSIMGRVRDQIIAPHDGIILGMATMPAVKPGEPVFHLALPDVPLETLRRKIAKRSHRALHQRIQTELATNIALKRARDLNPPEPDPPPPSRRRRVAVTTRKRT